MIKAEWGTKHLCPSCGAKFYDLKKKPPVCPKCETKVEPEPPKSRRRPTAPAESKAAESKAAESKAAAAGAESKAAGAENKAAGAESKAAAAGAADGDELVEGLEKVDDTEDKTEDESLPEDTNDLGGKNDVVGEVVGPADGKTEEG